MIIFLVCEQLNFSCVFPLARDPPKWHALKGVLGVFFVTQTTFPTGMKEMHWGWGVGGCLCPPAREWEGLRQMNRKSLRIELSQHCMNFAIYSLP